MGNEFLSYLYGALVKRPKTPPFHGGNTGSNPVGTTSVRELWTERYALTQVQPHRPKLDNRDQMTKCSEKRDIN